MLIARMGAISSYEKPDAKPRAAPMPIAASAARAVGRRKSMSSRAASAAAVTPKTMLSPIWLDYASTESTSHVTRARPSPGAARTNRSGASK